MLLPLVPLLCLLAQVLCYRPLQPRPPPRPFPKYNESSVGSPLYLTPYIDSGDIETGRDLARVDSTILEGINEDIESYSGFLTVDKINAGNLFFWFFPAEESPETAPVVIWLQGGPGASSMFGLLKLHGPILTKVDSNGQLTGVGKNPYSWARKHNMIYIDNPVGAGYSHGNKLPETQKEVTDNLYEFLQQWFKLFPSYQSNPYYSFGESYAGKYVPSLTRRIHEMNKREDVGIHINLQGMGIGDGFMSPYHNGQFGKLFYQIGIIDGPQRDYCLQLEQQMQHYIDQGQLYSAWQSWSSVLNYVLTKGGCGYAYNFAQCHTDPTEDNYEDFCNWPSTRNALHVGNLPFPNDGDPYWSLINVFMETGMHDVEYCLDNDIHTLVYDGNFDIICNHSGILDMFDDLQWKGKSTYEQASPSVYHYKNNEVIGYLKKAQQLNLLVVRNAGHMVPLSQPPYAQQMIEDFTSGRM